ncbi:hypothetical protein [Clostridium sp. CMCC3677]|uniref:hypothetical protein n=1 Tax=Clostridium sp. CMCC3677 TaxID=2949963 RepID=UPI0013F08356|nr:hypothetical protein [Clostridium sp. CMCC3677]NFG61357.1 hypothetical protein [Clostridium botulinum]NFQ09172.1 hypothetical protein [Clostridium botulinum]
MCIICFLQETFQYRLRKSAQMRSDRFEHTLYRYKNSFLTEFQENKNNLCEHHNNSRNKLIMEAMNNINITEIETFIKRLLNIYVLWINAEVSESISEFKNTLKDYGILEFDENIDNLILFRGRDSKEFISHWDMFHIPFNKRFFIGNQRYSLVGQPLLYLATSPYCVYRELEKIENLRISSFRFKNKFNMKIFNNSNLFYRYVKDNNDDTSIAVANNMIENNIEENYDFRKTLFLMILSSCCSFQRRSELKNTSFCEEYVLPQMLAQILKYEQFDGVMYTSTKAYYDENVKQNESLVNMVYKNICIFTNYDKEKINDVTYVYDKNLYERFLLSAPVMFEEKFNKEYYEPKKSLEIINSILNNVELISKVDLDILFSMNYMLISYNDMIIDKSNELENMFEKAINLHCLLLRNIILNIREDLKED